jgi:hypothetical protein
MDTSKDVTVGAFLTMSQIDLQSISINQRQEQHQFRMSQIPQAEELGMSLAGRLPMAP